ncbi:hypothetical protein BACCELL_04739 [Bacteroides cellulosilyticus DSM 14838]|uniref:Uncharacterized protein n=1 Tax=Bacteroides cellulosilyticus DSM 14838 TaxID=537012 RepID=E2NK98_9BACE|nr:hypothetical protein BACCELL_04739 [Bacteroides cellulosilyticus DSM 14838]
MLWEEDSHIKKYMKLQHKIFFSYWKLILDNADRCFLSALLINPDC